MLTRRNFLSGAAKAVGAVAAMAAGLLALSREKLYGGRAGGGMNGLDHLEGETVQVYVDGLALTITDGNLAHVREAIELPFSVFGSVVVDIVVIRG